MKSTTRFGLINRAFVRVILVLAALLALAVAAGAPACVGCF